MKRTCGCFTLCKSLRAGEKIIKNQKKKTEIASVNYPHADTGLTRIHGFIYDATYSNSALTRNVNCYSGFKL